MDAAKQKEGVRRVYTEKKKDYDVEARTLYRDLRDNLGIDSLGNVRIVNRYDISNITDEEYNALRHVIFSESPIDYLYEENVEFAGDENVFSVEYLPGQYDQRADSASQCIQFLTLGDRPLCKVAKLIVLKGSISDEDFDKIKAYCINPIDSREASMDKPVSLYEKQEHPGDVSQIEGFCDMSPDKLTALQNELGTAMTFDDLEFCRQYFKEEEKRDPTITEIRVIDTYWSDHCRHTTFLTKINDIQFENGRFCDFMKFVYKQYISSRKLVYNEDHKDICLMDLATIAMKELKKQGKLNDLDVSDEVNACSIVINAEVNGKNEDWLVMFKNETHNHPTEIEPFGGAATCLGGAIRDPLSGRAYVYQAMRVTGSGDPRMEVKDTLPGKLPQRKITLGAADGYSSYGNQIGLAAGQVSELYDEGYIAKRMEIGALIGAVPKRNVVRMKPETGDVVILLGGRTGRDGCGGATGSSKEHDTQSLFTCGAEVQKGNPKIERKILRLFRKEHVSQLIKKCNDFGAGGVSVAVGELADGLDIDLDKVPTKYEGLDGTELAISESQERMAVVVAKKDREKFIEAAADENLEATQIAVVTDTGRLKMKWRGRTIVDINREFLDTNGVKQNINVFVREPIKNYFREASPIDVQEAWVNNLQSLEHCCQKGLVEKFDSTIGAGTILMPFGGKYQLSPAEGMAAKLPVIEGDTTTCTLMSYGFNPLMAKWSPFHGAVYAVVEAVAKIVAMGGDYRGIRLTLQEYFEKLGKDPAKWGKPFSALLGAYYAQIKLGIPAIGGKDSMSGTFMDLNVPPTLVAFAVAVDNAGQVISTEFKKPDNQVVLLKVRKDTNELPDFEQLSKNYIRVYELSKESKILAAHTIRSGGIAEAVSRMCFGNLIGMEINETLSSSELFTPDYGSLALEIDATENVKKLFDGLNYTILGYTTDKPAITYKGTVLKLSAILDKWMQPLESVFPIGAANNNDMAETFSYQSEICSKYGNSNSKLTRQSIVKPRIYIPVFPGTNCEYDSAKAFENAGGLVDMHIIKNLTPSQIIDTIQIMKQKIMKCQIIMIPGGYSANDEPIGSGKFVATIFRNPHIKEAVLELLKNRDGLMLGISSGFQALIRLGLLPFAEFREIRPDDPTLTFNSIGKHVSCMVQTRIASNKSPWFCNAGVGDLHTIAVSQTEGRFIASEADMARMAANGQIATQYVDMEGNATNDARYNPNGSMHAIEGITSPDGRILGKMGHSERKGTYVCKNVPGNKNQQIFEAGVQYFS